MAYASGRTEEQFIRVCVLEGDTLYVRPENLHDMHEAINKERMYRQTKIVVDYELSR